jgi:hypothetical protein
MEISEGVVWHHERCALGAPLETQSKGGRERCAVITANAAGEPICLRIIEVRDMYQDIIHESAPHASRWVWFTLDLLEPRFRLSRGIGRTEVRDDVSQARVVDGEQDLRLFIVDEGFEVTVRLHHDTAFVEHP